MEINMGVYMYGAEIPPMHSLEIKLFGPIRVKKPTPEEREAKEKFQILMDQLRNIGDDEEWWFWKRIGSTSIHDKAGKLYKKKIKTCLKAFQQIFDNQWWRQHCQNIKQKITPDPLSYFGGQNPFFRIIRFGECISILRKNFLQEELIKKLKNHLTFRNAATELEIATCFAQENVLSEIYPEISGRKPDGKVFADGTEVYYEVTEQSWSDLYKLVFQAEEKLLNWVSKNLGVVNGQIRFLSGKEHPIRSAQIAIETLSKEITCRSLPLEHKTTLFESVFAKSKYAGGWLGISGLEPDSQMLIQRWVAQLFQKAKQLPSGKNGVIIGSPMFLWGPEEVDASIAVLTKKLTQQAHTRVCGFIFAAKHVENSGFLKHLPSVIINPRAKTRCDKAICRMAKALFTYPDWM